ncbi:DivIVA domain-containing protein [Nakamurella sp. GG22]
MATSLPPSRRSAAGGTAAAIRSVRFGVTEPFGRGYHPQEVDRFQEHCAAVVDALSNGWLACSQQVDLLRARLEADDSVPTEVADLAFDVEAEGRRRADELIAEAEEQRAQTLAECSALIERARLGAAAIIEEAHARAAALERQISIRAQRLAAAADLARQEVSREVAALNGAHPTERHAAPLPRPHGPLRAVSTVR